MKHFVLSYYLETLCQINECVSLPPYACLKACSPTGGSAFERNQVMKLTAP